MSSSIYLSCINDDPKIESFFSIKKGDFDSAIASAIGRKRMLAETEIEEIVEWNTTIGNSPKSIENAKTLLQTDTLAMITGQQAGLFTGPLYTIYKACNCIQLSKYLSEKSGINVVPIFWVASEDHDFEEVRHFTWLDETNNLREYRYEPAQYVPGVSVYDIPIESSLNTLVDQINSSTHPTEFKQSVISALRNAVNESLSMSDLFAKLLVRLLGQYGLVVISPHLKSLRAKAKDIVNCELSNPTTSSRLVNETNVALRQNGFAPSMTKHDNQLNVFLYIDKVRARLIYEDGVFIALDKQGATLESFEPSALKEIAHDYPERLSPGVVLRGVVQDYLFPTIAYVAGPGEVSYFASLKKVYEFFDVPMPMIYPRSSVTLIEPGVQRILRKMNISPTDLLGSRTLDRNVLTSCVSQTDIAKHFEAVREKCLGELADFRKELEEGLVSLDQAYEKFLSFTRQNFSKFEKRLAEQLKRRDRNLAQCEQRIVDSLYPHNAPQERVLNIFVPFALKYGFSITDKLLAEIDPFDNNVQFISLP